MDNKESTYKKKIEYNQRVHKVSCKDGKYYCRAVHAVLDANKNGVICGKGCPCFARIDEDGIICEYYDLNVNITNCTPKQNRQRAQVLIDSKIAPLFPNVWLKEGSRKTCMEKAFVFVSNQYRYKSRKNTKIPYGIHLVEVTNFITQLTTDIDIMVAGILHDVIENTSVSVEEIKEKFGEKITNIVSYGFADSKPEKLFNDDEWQKSYSKKIKNASKEEKIVLFADSLADLKKWCREYHIRKNDKIHGINLEKKDMLIYYKNLLEMFDEFEGTEPYYTYMECIQNLSLDN